MFPGQKVFYFWVILNITETAVNVGGTLHENQTKTKNIYLYIYSFMRDNANYVGALTHNYVRHCVLRYFLQMQHCRIMNFNLHIVEVIFEMSLWIWTQVFLALETRIKPSDKQATCVLNESTSWFRSDMLFRVCLSRWGTHLWRLLGRPLWQRRLSSTRWAQWLILSILTWSYVTCRICFLCFFV